MGHGGESGGGYVVGGGSDTAMAEAGDRANTERTDVRAKKRERSRLRGWQGDGESLDVR